MRINWQKIKVHNFFLYLGAVLTLWGCEEYQEGCMDAAAVNFKASNQIPCCCEYPSIVLQTTLTDGNETIPFADSLTNDLGQKYLIRDMRFLLSHIQLHDSLDRAYSPVDTFGDYIISPDILALNVRNLNNSGADFMKNGIFTQLNFSLAGISELSQRRPASFPMEHPLRDSSYYDFSTDRWIIAQTIVGLEDDNRKTIRLYGSDLNMQPEIMGRWTKELGRDLVVNFKVNAAILLSNLDFTSSGNELREHFKTNLSGAFEP